MMEASAQNSLFGISSSVLSACCLFAHPPPIPLVEFLALIDFAFANSGVALVSRVILGHALNCWLLTRTSGSPAGTSGMFAADVRASIAY